MKIAIIIFVAFITGCSPFVPVRDMDSVSQIQKENAMKIKVFTVNSEAHYPEIKKYIGPIEAYSCKHMMTDPPASKGDALNRLRHEALLTGANGIIDVTFSENGTDEFGTNCWSTVHASGTAVTF